METVTESPLWATCPRCGGGLPGEVPGDLVCRCGQARGDGAFDTKARAAIYNAAGLRCIGCGRTDLTCQHRVARGMGGTRSVRLATPANGVALCGHGTAGCHGWAEHHPTDAGLLGWRLAAGTDPVGVPFWTRHGWQAWGVEDDWWHVVLVDEELDLDQRPARALAVMTFKADAARRPVLNQWAPGPPVGSGRR